MNSRSSSSRVLTLAQRLRAVCALSVAALALAAGGCDGDDGETSETESDTTTTTTTTSTTTDSMAGCAMDEDCASGEVCADGSCIPEPAGWAVGGSGTVLRVSPTDGATVHPLALTDDLNAITCYGQTLAWFVGEGGVMGFTDDAGASWSTRAGGEITSATLHDVAATEPLRVAAAGEQGALLVSDNGVDFTVVPGPSGTLRGVDVSPFRVIAVGEDGVIWRHELGEEMAVETGSASAGLFAVDFGDHSPFGAAVGEGGTLLWTADGGLTWSPQELPTDDDLFDVQVAMDGDAWVAVGEAGAVVRKHSDGSITVERPVAADLLAIHLNTGGHGSIVGREGTALHTGDGGQTFKVIETGVAIDITGVDAIGDLHW